MVPGDDLLRRYRPRGLPIGNQTCQFWANVYLHALDQFVKQELRCKAYLRYCDDFMLFAADKPTLHRWRRAIEAFLVNLRLKIHAHKTSIHPVTRASLSWVSRSSRTTGVWDSAMGSISSGVTNILLRQLRPGRNLSGKLQQSVHGWIAHVEHADTWGLRRALLPSSQKNRSKPKTQHETIPHFH